MSEPAGETGAIGDFSGRSSLPLSPTGRELRVVAPLSLTALEKVPIVLVEVVAD